MTRKSNEYRVAEVHRHDFAPTTGAIAIRSWGPVGPTWNTFRDHLILEYDPKFDSDRAAELLRAARQATWNGEVPADAFRKPKMTGRRDLHGLMRLGHGTPLAPRICGSVLVRKAVIDTDAETLRFGPIE
jgi:hypothetical protein